jgi:hypothetical protein
MQLIPAPAGRLDGGGGDALARPRAVAAGGPAARAPAAARGGAGVRARERRRGRASATGGGGHSVSRRSVSPGLPLHIVWGGRPEHDRCVPRPGMAACKELARALPADAFARRAPARGRRDYLRAPPPVYFISDPPCKINRGAVNKN